MQNPIHKVLSTLYSHNVQALLMGGQACIWYGAAEFSRDTDIAVLASEENLTVLKGALRELHAKRIALPPFEQQYLTRGHAVHFRSYHPDAMNMRIDVMSVMRGVDPFDQLWMRRNVLQTEHNFSFNVLSLPDLVRAKKTQRDKDWPMIRRLIESDYIAQKNPSTDQVKFWLLESRTPAMLISLAQHYRSEMETSVTFRPLLNIVIGRNESAITDALQQEEKFVREIDREYWSPLKKELEYLRRTNIGIEEEV